MHNTVDYTKRLTPKFNAVEDIKEWLGTSKWNEVSPQMAKIKSVQAFNFLAELAGIRGFPVIAWYDLYHGEGSYTKAWEALDAIEEEQDYKPKKSWVLTDEDAERE